jgi:hypothetical protein
VVYRGSRNVRTSWSATQCQSLDIVLLPAQAPIHQRFSLIDAAVFWWAVFPVSCSPSPRVYTDYAISPHMHFSGMGHIVTIPPALVLGLDVMSLFHPALIPGHDRMSPSPPALRSGHHLSSPSLHAFHFRPGMQHAFAIPPALILGVAHTHSSFWDAIRCRCPILRFILGHDTSLSSPPTYVLGVLGRMSGLVGVRVRPCPGVGVGALCWSGGHMCGWGGHACMRVGGVGVRVCV